MKTIILFLLLTALSYSDRRIVSRPIKTEYNQYGGLTAILIEFKAYEIIYADDYFRVSLPETIHSSVTNLHYSIMTSNAYSAVDNQLSQAVSGSTYHFQAKIELAAEIWYILKIQVEKVMTTSLGLVQIEIVKETTTISSVKRSWNTGFQYYHIQNAAVPDLQILTIQLLTDSLSYKPAARYPIYIELTSTITLSESSQFQIGFIDPAVNTSDMSSLLTMQNSGNGFVFTGYCNSVCNQISGYVCIHSESCITDSNNLIITLPYINAGENYLIEAFVVNPTYSSSIRLETEMIANNGYSEAIAFSQNLLEVHEIAINPELINLLWGIPYDIVVNTMDLGLFVNDPSAQSLSLSSFDIGFSVADFSPIQGQYEVVIYVGAQSLLQSSINHNLPSLATTPEVYCRYIFPNIVCSGVDAFTRKNYRYYVRAKGCFMTSDSLGSFGNVNINLAEYPSQVIFTPLVRGLAIITKLNSDYHDYSALHSSSQNIRIGQTIVVSHKDTLLDNTTSNSMSDFLFSENSFVGIDPLVSPLQLNFLLSVDITQMSLPSPSNFGQLYEMRVFANPNIMNVSSKGLDIQSFSSVTHEWNVQNLPCYVDSSTTSTTQIFECQKYDDHVFDIQKYNNYVSNQYFHKYEWFCGDAGVGEVQCPTSDCSVDCQLFKGNFDSDSAAMGDADAGVLSIRNVTFLKNFQASTKASEKDLDFVIAFYQDGNFISASLINGYTLNSSRLHNLRADIINHYNDNTNMNQGERGPTLLKISGNFTLSEVGTTLISSLSIYLPNTLTISNFVEKLNDNTIGCSTKKCKGYLGGVTSSDDIWTQQQTIEVFNLPALTQNFNIILPVVFSSYQPLKGITVKLNTVTGITRGVFRVNGSSVNEILQDVPNHITDPWTPSVLWTPTTAEWVSDASYAFKQNIDVGSMQIYQPSINIVMGSSVFPTLDDSPSCTFTTAHVNIFSSFSKITINNGQKCIGPFSYTFQDLYPLWTFWCPATASSLNQILIGYPLYTNTMGTGFPFDQIFTYQYSNTKGQMIGYRVQQSTAYTPQQCSTIKLTEYYLKMITSQQSIFTVNIPPVVIFSQKSFLIKIGFPSTISFTFLLCKAEETSSEADLLCTLKTASGSNIQILLTNLELDKIIVNQVKITVQTIQSLPQNAVTPSYSINAYLPMTDSGTLQASLEGDVYSPFSSLFATCTNTFTCSQQASNTYIELSNPVLLADSAGYYGSAQFTVDFSDFRTTFFVSSSLVLTFSVAVLTDYSRCWFAPEYSLWSTYSIDATKKILTLFPHSDILDFTTSSYSVICSNIITTGSGFTMKMDWKDGITIAQTSISSITFSHTLINSVYTSGTGTLVSKLYNTNKYLSEYQFNLSLSVTTDHNLEIHIGVPLSNIHKNFLECQYYNGSSWIPVLCYPKSRNSVEEVTLEFFAKSAASFILLKVYGIPQQKKSIVPAITILAKKTAMSTQTSTYSVYNIPDTTPSTLASSPIIINNLVFNSSLFVTIDYTFPIVYSSNLYIEIDELFTMPYTFSTSTNFTCSINGTALSCARKRPNLIKITSTLTHKASDLNQIILGPFSLSSRQQYDEQFVFFNMFATSTSTDSSVLIGSHLHIQEYISKTDIIPSYDYLLWNITDTEIMCQIVYLGYYGPPAYIVTKSGASFAGSVTAQIKSPTNHTLILKDLSIELGTDKNEVLVGTLDSSVLGYHFLQFSHSSSVYPSIQPLPVYISTKKCSISTEFDQYTIIREGQTIPIVLNFTLCRPITSMTMILSVDSQYIQKNQALTTQLITSNTELAYIILQHPLDTLDTLNNDYTLTITFSSTQSIVVSAYQTVPSVKIRVVDPGNIIGNPEGVQPQINQIGADYANFTLECSAPSTIYWGVGLYPVMLGINDEEIEARLIETSNGLTTKVLDIYSWSKEIYGVTYSKNFDGQVVLFIDGLQGDQKHVFKYFCVDQSGTASGGKITEFYTLPSNYSLVKINMAFDEKLSYSETNQLACALSQILTIPYNETITSTFSNCINTSDAYYSSSQLIYDQLKQNSVNGQNQYHYFFYVDSKRISKSDIIYKTNKLLGTNQLFMDATIPYYSSLRIDSLKNAYEPEILSFSLDTNLESFSLTIDVGYINVYLIAGYMGKHFDSSTMSMPTHYLMKKGYFSEKTRFTEIYSIYGHQNLTVTFSNLTQGTQYSVFYFVTVDNSALNARHSLVSYIDLKTATRPYIDLSAPNLLMITMLSVLAFGLLL